MPWRTALLAPLVVAIAALVCFVPFLTRERAVIEYTPQPPPMFQPATITLLLGPKVCASPIPINKRTDIARLHAGTYPDATPTLIEATVEAPGYLASASFLHYTYGQALDIPLPDPPHPLDATLCVRNGGSVAGLVLGNAEGRGRGRLTTTQGGKPAEAQLEVTLLQKQPQSVIARLAEVFGHAAALQPGFAPDAVLWILAALVLLGVPAGAALALRRATPSSGVEANGREPQPGQVERYEPADQQRAYRGG